MRGYYTALFRYRRRAIAFFVAVIVLVVLRLVLSPRAYLSEVKLFVRIGRQSATLDPTATTGQFIHPFNTREAEINSVMESLSSRTVMERVVDAVDPKMAACVDSSSWVLLPWHLPGCYCWPVFKSR